MLKKLNRKINQFKKNHNNYSLDSILSFVCSTFCFRHLHPFTPRILLSIIFVVSNNWKVSPTIGRRIVYIKCHVRYVCLWLGISRMRCASYLLYCLNWRAGGPVECVTMSYTHIKASWEPLCGSTGARGLRGSTAPCHYCDQD